MPANQAVLPELPPVAGNSPPGAAVVVGEPKPPSIVVVGATVVVVAGGYASTAAPPMRMVPPAIAQAAIIRFIIRSLQSANCDYSSTLGAVESNLVRNNVVTGLFGHSSSRRLDRVGLKALRIEWPCRRVREFVPRPVPRTVPVGT